MHSDNKENTLAVNGKVELIDGEIVEIHEVDKRLMMYKNMRIKLLQ